MSLRGAGWLKTGARATCGERVAGGGIEYYAIGWAKFKSPLVTESKQLSG